MQEDNPSIAFLGSLVPDTKEYHNQAFNRSGNLVQAGLVEGLSNLGVKLKVYSSQPCPTFPRFKKVLIGKKVVKYSNKLDLNIIPTLNILIVRELLIGIYCTFSLIKWAIVNRKFRRCLFIYNVYTPPLPFIYFLGKLTGSKTIALIYDLGIPPKSLKRGILRRGIYYLCDIYAKIFIPKLDGRIVINDAIVRDYAPNRDFLLVDGGVGPEIIKRLFPLELKPQCDETIFLCAGSLWQGNGVDLILNAMGLNHNPKILMWFAGKGDDVSKIQKAAQRDARICYLGLLDLDQLFEAYKRVDVLMNIRVIPKGEGDYLFPSKLLEYLTIGKLVVSTPVAHIQKVYGPYCIILPESDPQVLSDLIDCISNKTNKELFEMGTISREYMLNNGTWEIRCNKIMHYITNQVFSA